MPDGESSSIDDLCHSCAEGRHTIDKQIEKIHREDQKAVGITRLNMLLLGLFASAVSVSLRTEQITTSEFFNIHVGFGTIALLLSTFIAAMAYTSSTFKLGVSPKPLEEVKGGDVAGREYYEILSGKYQEWIKRNRKVHKFNAVAIAYALVLVLCGLLFFLTGISVGVAGLRGEPVSWGMLIVVVLISPVIAFFVLNSDDTFEAIMEINNDD